MFKRRSFIVGVALLGVLATANAQESVDLEMVAKIREEGYERSQVDETFNHFVNVIGPRLTASPAYNEAARWSRDRLEAWGMENAVLEAWEFGRGWTLERLSIEMVEPRYMPLIGFPRGWSPSTDGKIVGEPIMLAGLSSDEIAQLQDRLQGGIVMTRPIETRFIRTDRDPPVHDPPAISPPTTFFGSIDGSQRATRGARRGGQRGQRGQRRGQRGRGQRRGRGGVSNAMLRQAGVGVTLEPSRGEHGTLFVTGRDQGENALPSIVLIAEHYNLIANLLAANVPVKLEINIETRFHTDDTNGYNVIAEIPGVDPEIGDEVVMVGAHLDSWHSATGATDNADGSAVVMEALRILKAIGARPRRTIRVGLWGGEEQGLHGSRHYVERHLAGDANAEARDKFSIYFNLDPGTGPIHGWFLEGNEAIRPFFEANLKPFADLGADTITMRGIGSTDHLNFIRVGLPGFEAIHDYINYDVREHHTNMDFAERIEEGELKQASVVMASLLYHAAMRDELMPRDPPGEGANR